jgi:hypothetical protein
MKPKDIRYNWVRHGAQRLLEIGINVDGSLHNPNGYPDGLVREAVLAAEDRRKKRRQEAAGRAAVTRKRRRNSRSSKLRRVSYAKRALALSINAASAAGNFRTKYQ